MKLWLLSQDVNNDYYTYDSCVVAAETEEDARVIAPNGKRMPGWRGRTRRGWAWARRPEQVTVKLIGTAEDGTPEGVILASFNAG